MADLNDRVFEGNMGAPDDSLEEVCERQHEEIEGLRVRLQEVEAERDRLAAALTESQAREAEIVELAGKWRGRAEILGRLSAVPHGLIAAYNQVAEEAEAALASPSQAAEAIGMVIKEAESLAHWTSDPGCRFILPGHLGELRNRVAALQALRAGAGEDRSLCPNDGTQLELSADPKLSGCYECPKCGFVQGFRTIYVGEPPAEPDKEQHEQA